MLNFDQAWMAYRFACRAKGQVEGSVVDFVAGFNAAVEQMSLGQTNVEHRLPGLPCQNCVKCDCGDECPGREWRPEKTEWGGEWV